MSLYRHLPSRRWCRTLNSRSRFDTWTTTVSTDNAATWIPTASIQGSPARRSGPNLNGPRPPIDVTGPRLPRLLQNVVAARCFNCSTALPPDVDWKGKCPKCGAALHCCKQCAHFEPSTRFQCLKPIPARIAGKDQANDCELFKPRVTVARDAAPAQQPPQPGATAAAATLAQRRARGIR